MWQQGTALQYAAVHLYAHTVSPCSCCAAQQCCHLQRMPSRSTSNTACTMVAASFSGQFDTIRAANMTTVRTPTRAQHTFCAAVQPGSKQALNIARPHDCCSQFNISNIQPCCTNAGAEGQIALRIVRELANAGEKVVAGAHGWGGQGHSTEAGAQHTGRQGQPEKQLSREN